jgi:hypothetical protein
MGKRFDYEFYHERRALSRLSGRGLPSGGLFARIVVADYHLRSVYNLLLLSVWRSATRAGEMWRFQQLEPNFFVI